MKKGIILFILVLASCLFSVSLELSESGYFEKTGLNVMVFDDFYPEGHQGAVTIILNGERVAGNGDVRLSPTPGQWQPIPKIGKKNVLADKNEVNISLSFPDSSRDKKGFNPIDYPDLNLTYTIRVTPAGEGFRVLVDLEKPLPDEWIGRVGFNMELFPGTYFGKTYLMDGQSGLFPRQLNGPLYKDVVDEYQVEPMAVGQELLVSPECENTQIRFKSLNGDLQLIDGRAQHSNGWYVVRSTIPKGAVKGAIEWLVTPNANPDFMYKPVVQLSQVGYHPAQPKIAVVELDKNDKDFKSVVLKKYLQNGEQKIVVEKQAKEWGTYLRYNYLQFDFTDITEPGLYQIFYGDVKSNPFQIDEKIYDRHVWQPTLEYFLPVQMCHMLIKDRYRVWHGRCHMDDALMAPTNYNHFDGYKQGESTLCEYEPFEPVPGLNVGGWHDAGDYDLRVESQIGTVYILALAYEQFNVMHDETTINQEIQTVNLHQPDGKPDILQQIEHGVFTVLGGYKSLGRLYRGIICPTLEQYVLLGDGSTMTDNTVYNETVTADKSGFGPKDDRWVFTEINPRREIQTCAGLAAAARVLRGYNDSLADDCLKAASELFESIDMPMNRKLSAAAELFLTTGDKKYEKLLLENTDALTRRVGRTARILGRLVQKLDNKKFTKAATKAVKEYVAEVEKQGSENPYGVPYRPHIWGAGWNIQNFGVTQYFLYAGFPDIFPKDYMLNALNFVLGCHPGSNTASYASGVGSNSVTTAYGVNRADWSYIPGGSVSGTGIVRPDLPELKEWPFFWHQTEYVMGGGASNFMFLALAAQNVLN